MTQSRSRSPISEALQRFISAESPESALRAWANLAACVQGPDDIRLIAERARAAERALVEEIKRRKELIEALEAGPNPLLPAIMDLQEDGHFVVSLGHGQFHRVSCQLDAESGQPVLTPDDLEQFGPVLVALDPGGSTIVRAYPPTEDRNLLFDLFAADQGTLEGVGGGDEDQDRAVSVNVPAAGES